MVYKWVEATTLREGNYAIIEDAPCIIKKIDISKTGKHGASKVRIEAVGLIDGKKRITVMPGHEKIEVPLIEKKKAQVLSINKHEKKVGLMDLQSYESFEIDLAEELVNEINEGDEVEYWDIEGVKIIKRKL